VLLERQSRRREAGTRTGRARRMLANEALKMLVCRGAVAPCLFQLGE